MTSVLYRNHEHYIREGWAKEPKESFKALAELLRKEGAGTSGRVLDVGCATGELIGYLHATFPRLGFTGIDVAAPLLEQAQRLLPEEQFVRASALSIPESFTGQFDIVTAIGCMSIFDENEVQDFWRNLLRCVAPGGLAIVLSPLNEYGVDMIVRHRKRMSGVLGSWESGWNIFSKETIAEVIKAQGAKHRFEKFTLPVNLPAKDDPVRTWTLPTRDNPQQLTNGMKLLVDHYFMIARKLCVKGDV